MRDGLVGLADEAIQASMLIEDPIGQPGTVSYDHVNHTWVVTVTPIIVAKAGILGSTWQNGMSSSSGSNTAVTTAGGSAQSGASGETGDKGTGGAAGTGQENEDDSIWGDLEEDRRVFEGIAKRGGTAPGKAEGHPSSTGPTGEPTRGASDAALPPEPIGPLQASRRERDDASVQLNRNFGDMRPNVTDSTARWKMPGEDSMCFERFGESMLFQTSDLSGGIIVGVVLTVKDQADLLNRLRTDPFGTTIEIAGNTYTAITTIDQWVGETATKVLDLLSSNDNRTKGVVLGSILAMVLIPDPFKESGRTARKDLPRARRSCQRRGQGRSGNGGNEAGTCCCRHFDKDTRRFITVKADALSEVELKRAAENLLKNTEGRIASGRFGGLLAKRPKKQSSCEMPQPRLERTPFTSRQNASWEISLSNDRISRLTSGMYA